MLCAYVYMYINIIYISDTKFSQLLKKHLTKNPLFQKAMHVSEKSYSLRGNLKHLAYQRNKATRMKKENILSNIFEFSPFYSTLTSIYILTFLFN
jgi:deoxycytidine triphosphate deaminase